MNYNILYAVGLVVALFVFVKWIAPYLKKNNMDYYNEIKLALLLCGYAFRSDKIKAIASIALAVVTQLEQLVLTPEEKHQEAVAKIADSLLKELNIELDRDALDIIVQIAVSLLPPTHQK